MCQSVFLFSSIPKNIEAGEGLLWEKITGAVFGTMRATVTLTEYTSAAKRRKLK